MTTTSSQAKWQLHKHRVPPLPVVPLHINSRMANQQGNIPDIPQPVLPLKARLMPNNSINLM